jgi:predicted kinase
MMQYASTDDVVKLREGLREALAGEAGSPTMLVRDALTEVIDELLQRRKDGASPEEFVVLMAGRLADVPDSERPMFLAALADIASGLRKVREALPR